MVRKKLLCRITALVLTLAFAVVAAVPGLAAYPMPIQTAAETEAVYLFDLDRGKTILAQNSDQQKYVASLTKLMTALLLLESDKDLSLETNVSTELAQEFKDIQNANGSTINLRIGEDVRRIDLLNAILVSSANDASSVIAYDLAGSLTGFVQQMNARAQELGCTSTNFTCAHGLYDYGNVSTAEDIAKIATACFANETFVQIASEASYTLPATNLHKTERTISSTMPLTDPENENYRSYILCAKGGFTTLAGRCCVAFAQQDGHTYGLVLLGSDTASVYTEVVQIFDWVFESFSEHPLVDTETLLTTLPLTDCRSESAVELYAAEPLSGYGHAEDAVSYVFDLPEKLSATVKQGQKVGTATVYLDGYEVGTVELVTHRKYVSDLVTDSKATLLLFCVLLPVLAALAFFTLVAGGGSLNLNKWRGKHRRK